MKQQITGFTKFEESCKKEVRGGVTMYDIKGCHKWLTIKELITYYFSKII
jgi:hypothetical protein